MAAPTAVLARIWPPLVTVAMLVFIVFGIPVSGGPANLASFSPAFLRVLDPAQPLGVAASVVRNVVYFDGHATARTCGSDRRGWRARRPDRHDTAAHRPRGGGGSWRRIARYSIAGDFFL